MLVWSLILGLVFCVMAQTYAEDQPFATAAWTGWALAFLYALAWGVPVWATRSLPLEIVAVVVLCPMVIRWGIGLVVVYIGLKLGAEQLALGLIVAIWMVILLFIETWFMCTWKK